jgi:antirestriction protein
MEKSEMRIYVSSLADYNAGNLHGVWIDLDGHDIDSLKEKVKQMLAQSPLIARWGEAPEEYAVHDFELGGIEIDEHTSLERILDIYERLPENYFDLEICLAYCELMGASSLDHALDHWEVAFLCCADSEREFAESYVEEMVYDVPDWLVSHIDYDSVARDLFSGGLTFWEGYVFQDV